MQHLLAFLHPWMALHHLQNTKELHQGCVCSWLASFWAAASAAGVSDRSSPAAASSSSFTVLLMLAAA